jgi:hypothetical protein
MTISDLSDYCFRKPLTNELIAYIIQQLLLTCIKKTYSFFDAIPLNEIMHKIKKDDIYAILKNQKPSKL